ncbi:hypothetical protein [uncultured Arcticibacterium sp.]|uniref:hypothetical protein n=1 Tax=uncultured Arcticibacterium sp. TaxID=2173042 RepID=UPI0030FA9909
MKYQFLPHYFKYIALISFIPVGVISIINGWNEAHWTANGITFQHSEFEFLLTLTTLISIIIYALAKDKIFDDYIQKIRMESIYLVFFGTLVYIGIRLIIDKNWSMEASTLCFYQIVFYLLLNKVRKNTLPD